MGSSLSRPLQRVFNATHGGLLETEPPGADDAQGNDGHQNQRDASNQTPARAGVPLSGGQHRWYDRENGERQCRRDVGTAPKYAVPMTHK